MPFNKIEIYVIVIYETLVELVYILKCSVAGHILMRDYLVCSRRVVHGVSLMCYDCDLLLRPIAKVSILILFITRYYFFVSFYLRISDLFLVFGLI